MLTGVGDLLIGVDKNAFLQAQESKRKEPGQFILFLNGVPLPHDASLMSSEHVDNLTVLRYRINQGAEVQRLWSMLFADKSLFDRQPLYASLGWQPASGDYPMMIPVRPATVADIRVTTHWQLTIAIVLVLFTIATVVFLGRSTDSLRDTEPPVWWTEAKTLQREVISIKDDTTRDTYLTGQYPGAYSAQDRPHYKQRAEAALSGEQLIDADVVATKFGLALRTDNWTLRRASYSLSRTQLALWFTFTVATGLFLWLLYGDLRRIDGSILILLGISVGTAGLSWTTDRNTDGRAYSPTKGFWADLLTGFDERKQLHRYQAVVVNLLLLVVGIYHVVEQLNYPVFDPTWLILLGISGSAYGVGKQILETK